MKVLAILGSPRKKGNSETLLHTILDAAGSAFQQDLECIYLHGLKDLSCCMSCGSCEKTGTCVIKDDMVPLYEKIDLADILFMVTPVYFYGPTAQIKKFIDRFQPRWSKKYLLKEPQRTKENRFGFLLSTGATKGAKVFDANILITKNFFDTVDFPYSGEFLIRSVDDRDSLKKNEAELARAREFGRDIAKRILGEEA